jgi:hypothetical protein
MDGKQSVLTLLFVNKWQIMNPFLGYLNVEKSVIDSMIHAISVMFGFSHITALINLHFSGLIIFHLY